MKTIEEFIKEIESSEALQNEIKEIKDKDTVEALLKRNECGFTAEEFVKTIKPEGVIPDDDAENAAGGESFESKFRKALGTARGR